MKHINNENITNQPTGAGLAQTSTRTKNKLGLKIEELKKCIPYNRPNKLSDPFSDFAEYELKKILGVDDSEMGWKELCCIFQGSLPAGEYKEAVYFIPFALNFINSSREESSFLIDGFVTWCDYNYQNLNNDGLANLIIEIFHNYFETWITNFLLKKCKDGFYHPLYEAEISSFIDKVLLLKNLKIDVDLWLKKNLLPLKHYSQAAWIIVFLNNYNSKIFGLSSGFIKQLKNDNTIKDKAVDMVLSKSLLSNDDVLIKYWDHELTYFG